MTETAYVVLRRYEHRTDATAHVDLWSVENSNVPAASAEAAIRLACKTDDKASGVYVAVPARSWKPVKVAAVQTTALKLESADTRTKEPA